MSSFAKSLIKRHSERFNRGNRQLSDKRQEWEALVERSTRIFESVKIELTNQSFFKNLYMLDSRKLSEFEGKPPFIQFSFNQHKLGYKELASNMPAMESGCSLTIDQLVNGTVACTFYPFSSTLASRKEKYIIAKVVRSPRSLTEAEVEKLIKQLFSYAQVSSIFGSPQLTDWKCIYCLKTKHWWLHFRLSKIALNLLDKATGATVDHFGS